LFVGFGGFIFSVVFLFFMMIYFLIANYKTFKIEICNQNLERNQFDLLDLFDWLIGCSAVQKHFLDYSRSEDLHRIDAIAFCFDCLSLAQTLHPISNKHHIVRFRRYLLEEFQNLPTGKLLNLLG